MYVPCMYIVACLYPSINCVARVYSEFLGGPDPVDDNGSASSSANNVVISIAILFNLAFILKMLF